MKKKIHKLSINPEIDFRLIGISSHENDYRISWAINKQLRMNLTQTENLKIFNRKLQQEQEFGVFSFEDEERFLKYNLISNRCNDGFLLHDLKNIDFFIQVFGEITDPQFQNLIKQLRQIDIITAAFIIIDLPAKSMEKLIF